MKTRSIGLAVIAAGALLAVGAVSDDRVDDAGRDLRLHGAAYNAMRDAAFARAGLPVSTQCHEAEAATDCMIVDHLVPICLMRFLPWKKDANKPFNIQIQPCAEWNGSRCVAGDAYDKDLKEDAACADVQAGRTTPAEAAARPEFRREWP